MALGLDMTRTHKLQTVCFKKKRTIHTQESNLEIDEACLADTIDFALQC